MKVKLTDEQILQLAANAVNAASPMGMGFMHFQEKDYEPNDIKPYINKRLDGDRLLIDYFEGHMTKLSLKQDGEGYWNFPDRDPRSDYQSWCVKYPTYQDLIDSVVN